VLLQQPAVVRIATESAMACASNAVLESSDETNNSECGRLATRPKLSSRWSITSTSDRYEAAWLCAAGYMLFSGRPYNSLAIFRFCSRVRSASDKPAKRMGQPSVTMALEQTWFACIPVRFFRTRILAKAVHVCALTTWPARMVVDMVLQRHLRLEVLECRFHVRRVLSIYQLP
jgi:hypothetical protein